MGLPGQRGYGLAGDARQAVVNQGVKARAYRLFNDQKIKLALGIEQFATESRAQVCGLVRFKLRRLPSPLMPRQNSQAGARQLGRRHGQAEVDRIGADRAVQRLGAPANPHGARVAQGAPINHIRHPLGGR